MSGTAIIVGAGQGLSASLARLLAREGYAIVLAARDADKLAALTAEVDGRAIACDATRRADVEHLFETVARGAGTPDVVIYNASARLRGPLVELDEEAVFEALKVTAYGGFLVGQAAAKTMLPAGKGTILLTGASASVKGYARSAPFAMGKFALRGLAQSIARELQPAGIHVAHIVIDGGIRNPGRTEPPDKPDSLLDPDAIAETYLHLIRQPRSAWAWEIELRPWVESF